jgi:hypothetical protein
VKLFASRGNSDDPEPMTDQDLADWGGIVDARAQEDRRRGVTRGSVIAAGQAAVDVTNARRGKK